MSKNGISKLPSKQARQSAKLNLAQTKRAATGTKGYRQLHTLDTTELPSVYSDNTSVAQSHITGLIKGRPWK
jgi:hypothetical protein